MPIYDYECPNCNETIEVTHKMNEQPIINCYKCNQNMIKLISGTSFRLSGIGYYETDFKSKNRRNIKIPDHSDVIGGQE